ncbi:MAG: hypothetical protein J6Y54_06555 [Lentisphaeria bacterium]|nr:hypothetical protein [Lentisphaeria bacterium]
MSKFLKSPKLLRRETPEALDRRILLAGALAAARYRSTRRRRFFGALSGAAAAVIVAAVATWHVNSGIADRPTSRGKIRSAAVVGAKLGNDLSERELMEFDDWTVLEQENYNLASQLNCCQDEDDGFFSQV